MEQPAVVVEELVQEALDLARQVQQALSDQPACMLCHSIQAAESFGAIAILLQSFKDSDSRGYGAVVWGEQALSKMCRMSQVPSQQPYCPATTAAS